MPLQSDHEARRGEIQRNRTRAAAARRGTTPGSHGVPWCGDNLPGTHLPHLSMSRGLDHMGGPPLVVTWGLQPLYRTSASAPLASPASSASISICDARSARPARALGCRGGTGANACASACCAWVSDAAGSATLVGPDRRTAASHWALGGSAARPECVSQPQEPGESSPRRPGRWLVPSA